MNMMYQISTQIYYLMILINRFIIINFGEYCNANIKFVRIPMIWPFDILYIFIFNGELHQLLLLYIRYFYIIICMTKNDNNNA